MFNLAENNRRIITVIGALSIIIIFHLALNYNWLRKNMVPKGSDDILHHLITTDIYRQLIINHADKNLFNAVRALMRYKSSDTVFDNNWPILMHCIAAFSMIVFGASRLTVMLVNQLYFILLIVSVFLIGRYCRDNHTGLLAAFFISIYPGVWGMSRSYELDFALAAFMALTVYLLLRTENFSRRAYSFLFAIVFGLAINIKAQAVFFIIGPLGYIIFKRSQPKANMFNILSAMVLILFMSYFWWKGRFAFLWDNFLRHVFASYVQKDNWLWIDLASKDPFRPFNLGWFFYYLITIYELITPFSLFIFVMSAFFFNKILFKHKGVILAWIVVPYIIFTLISGKACRYYLPAYPALALISAAGIMDGGKKYLLPVVASIVLLGGCVYFVYSFGMERPAIFKTRYFAHPWWHKYENDPDNRRITKMLSKDIISLNLKKDCNIVVLNMAKRQGFDFGHMLRYLIDVKYAKPNLRFINSDYLADNKILDYAIIIKDKGDQSNFASGGMPQTAGRHEFLFLNEEFLPSLDLKVALYKAA